MKMLFIAKTGVFIMTLLILAGLTLVVFKIADNAQKHKPQMQPTAFLLEPDEKITQLTGCAEYLCALTEKAGTQNRLLVINPATGRLHTETSLKTQ